MFEVAVTAQNKGTIKENSRGQTLNSQVKKFNEEGERERKREIYREKIGEGHLPGMLLKQAQFPAPHSVQKFP